MTTTTNQTQSALLAHLFRRAGFGPTPEDMDRALKTDYENVVAELMDFESEDAIPEDVICRYNKDQSDLRGAGAGGAQWIYRMVMTENPLKEKMCLRTLRVLRA